MAKKSVVKEPVKKVIYKEDCKQCKGTGKHFDSLHACTFCHGLSKK